MKLFSKVVAAAVCALAASAANADFLDSHIAYHNDVIYHSFIIDSPTDLTAWTDSYGLDPVNPRNFDPMVSLWREGVLVAANDDNPTIRPGEQGTYDSGFQVYNLMPGSYLFTIAAYDNYANGSTLGAGFQRDGEAPIALADWCEPAGVCNPGRFVRLNWEMSPAVPEPSTWAMLAAGLALTGAAARRQRR
jgi:PEP-CTERM motif